ncbi:hypothetical protein [Rubinisphaera italica]|uniref:Uncharacterized protein n=1 Tax=Rubinisphaera italica TaxID=2527969 RepID=A0A5C5XF39_9PLAN|nr:hypothetical protein [Rubinisphaera italica]TWT61706.1 hypothetical protein Pan54_24430 [Rubinisphaera italica]
MQYTSGTSPGNVVFEVDASDSPIAPQGNGYYSIGITNRSSSESANPTHIKIEFWDSSTSSYTTLYDQDVEIASGYGAWVSPRLLAPLPGYFVYKARVTLTIPGPLPANYRLQRLMLYHATGTYDPWHLHLLGGTLYGPLALEDNFSLKGISAPSSPSSGICSLYQDESDDCLRAKFSNGTIAQLATLDPVISKSSTYTIQAGDEVILCDASGGAFTITLPSAVDLFGRQYTIKRTNSGVNDVTLGTTSSQTIDGQTTQVLGSQYDKLTVVSDGSNWMIV